MSNIEKGGSNPESELSREQRLKNAIDLASLFFQKKVNQHKETIEGAKSDVRSDLKSFIDGVSERAVFNEMALNEYELDQYKEFLHKAKSGDFFSKVSINKISVYDYLKEGFEGTPKDIEEIKNNKEGHFGDETEVKELIEELNQDLAAMESAAEAIEATDEFKEF